MNSIGRFRVTFIYSLTRGLEGNEHALDAGHCGLVLREVYSEAMNGIVVESI